MAESNSKNSYNCGKKPIVLVIVMCLVAIILAGCFVWQTVCFHKTRLPESISISMDTKGQRKKLSDVAEKDIKEQLFVAFMSMAEKAESNYNDKFMALLTILSIFGIVWPIVIAYLQKMNLEEDRAKITEALGKYISLSDDLQKQKTSNLEMIQTIETMSEDLQKQKTSNSEMIQTIETMSEDLQKQKKEIKKIQMEGQIQFGTIQLKYANDFGPVFLVKKHERTAYESSDDLTKMFKVLTDLLDTHYQGELIAMSENNNDYNFPSFIQKASKYIYNLVFNYNNINAIEVIPYLDNAILSVESLNQSNLSIAEALRLLKCTKLMLKNDHPESKKDDDEESSKIVP